MVKWVLVTLYPLAFALFAVSHPEIGQAETGPASSQSATAKAAPTEPAAQAPAAAAELPGRTGLPLPRFVTLRAPQVNLRTGPGTRYPIDWVYKRRGLPVEIIDEFGNWRQIRDWQGVVGWVHRSMLQGKRGILVIGKERVLRDKPAGASNGVALVEAGVIGRLRRCEDRWCLVEVKDLQGWLQRNEIYGLQPDEHF